MYSNNLTSLRHWSRLSCICRYSTALEGQKVPQVSKSIDGISPPPRINRGCTDILQALAATVKPDPTGAHYKYHDDPYLIPLSNYRKRAYALSAEAGRKAAAWIRDEHAELFTEREWDPPTKKKTPHFNADPHIDAFLPRPIYNDESKVTEKDLKYTIENALLEDSIKVYQLLGGKEGVSDEMKISFLQFLCFCNEKEPDSLEWLEERWFAANTRERISTKWKLGGLADNIFESIEKKTPEAYCAIIQGMAKYYQAERAYVMTQEAIEKGIQLSTGVFNALLGCVGFMKEGVNQRIQMMNTIMTQMNQQGLSPDVETLSSCLRSVSAWGGGPQLQQLARDLVAEFRRLGVEPGLSAYYYLLCLYCKERGPRVDILTSILKDLESRETLEAKETTDTHFFLTAMGVCSDHLQDLNLAERIHALLMKGDNYKLVGDAYKESIYYRHFVTITCRQAPLEKTLNLLDTLIPNVYVPEPTVMEEIIKTLELGGAGARLAQAWSQLVVFGHAKRTRLVQRLLAAMCACYRYQDDEIKAKMRESAVDILKSNQTTQEREETMEFRSPPPKLSATALCHIIEMCADDGGEHAAWESVSAGAEQLRRGEAAGVPAEPRPLLDVATAAAAAGQPSVAASIMSYLSECGFEEAASGGELVLGALLNRPAAEARELLQRPRAEVAAALHPAALAVYDAYHTAKSGGSMMEEDTSSASSESDDMTSSDEEM